MGHMWSEKKKWRQRQKSDDESSRANNKEEMKHTTQWSIIRNGKNAKMSTRKLIIEYEYEYEYQ